MFNEPVFNEIMEVIPIRGDAEQDDGQIIDLEERVWAAETAWEYGPQCRDGQHDFELLPVPGGWGIVEGSSRCSFCETIADETKVDGPGPQFRRGDETREAGRNGSRVGNGGAIE